MIFKYFFKFSIPMIPFLMSVAANATAGEYQEITLKAFVNLSGYTISIVAGPFTKPGAINLIEPNKATFLNIALKQGAKGAYTPRLLIFIPDVTRFTPFGFMPSGKNPNFIIVAKKPSNPSGSPDYVEIDFNEISQLAQKILAEKESAAKSQLQKLPEELVGEIGKFSLTGYVAKNLLDLVSEYLARQSSAGT